jgi:hypothetical protein
VRSLAAGGGLLGDERKRERPRFLEFVLVRAQASFRARRSSATASPRAQPTKRDTWLGARAKANNVELACTLANSWWFNRRYISWQNRHADGTRLGQVVAHANTA